MAAMAAKTSPSCCHAAMMATIAAEASFPCCHAAMMATLVRWHCKLAPWLAWLGAKCCCCAPYALAVLHLWVALLPQPLPSHTRRQVSHWELERGLAGVALAQGHMAGLQRELAAGRMSTALVMAQVRA